ncbi:unnamed protein product, partial [Brassica oleracea var. botrytis]
MVPGVRRTNMDTMVHKVCPLSWLLQHLHQLPKRKCLKRLSQGCAGVNYRETVGPDSQLLNQSFIGSDFLKLQPLTNLKWYDYCFSEVVPGRIVRSLNELEAILPSVQRDKTIVLVSLFDAEKMFIRNLLCHFENLDTQNHIFIGSGSELFYDLARRGHPVIDADMFIKSKASYTDSVKEAYVVEKCLELGYSAWVFSSKVLLVDKGLLLDRIRSEEYDFYIGESSGVLIVQSSLATQKLWSNELMPSIVSSATKNPSPQHGLDFIHLVKELLEQKGKKVRTVETMSIAENINVRSVNQWLEDGLDGKPVVYWSHEVDSNTIQTKLVELDLWLVDDDLSCKAVICQSV